MPPKVSPLPLVFAAFAFVVAFAVAAIGTRESLWLDELHTAWVATAPVSQLVERAQAGNQTPLYFLAIRALVGPPSANAMAAPSPAVNVHTWWSTSYEQQLRLPSAIAWGAALLILGAIALQSPQRSECKWTLTAMTMLWAAIDQVQWFYGTEARPYAWVQLASLLGWWIVVHVSDITHGPLELPHRVNSLRKWCLVWSCMAALMVHLHLTAALLVLAQWAVLFAVLVRNDPRRTIGILAVATVVVVLGISPLFYLIGPVWQRRVQWSSFASDSSMGNLLTMFPLLPVLVPATVGLVMDRFQFRSATRPHDERRINVGVWIAAFSIPLLLAWGLTGSGIAPLMHRRFLIGCSLPVYCLAGELLARFKSRRWRLICGSAIVISLCATQGTYEILRAPSALGKMRGEDWRGAARWISMVGKSGDLIACASGLIEAQTSKPPISDNLEQYLMYPLDSIYRPAWVESSNTSSLIGLVNDDAHWAEQVMPHLKKVTPASSAQNRLWLVYRGRQEMFVMRSQNLMNGLNRVGVRAQVLEERTFGWVRVRLISLEGRP